MSEKKEKLFFYFLFVGIAFLLGSIFYQGLYSPDAYNISVEGFGVYDQYAMSNMRPLQSMITDFFLLLLGENVNYFIVYRLYLTFALILLGSSMYLVYQKIIALLKNRFENFSMKKLKKCFLILSISLMFFPGYIADNLIYVEAFTMMLALFLAVFASVVYASDKKGKLIFTLILLILSEFLYQTMITAFVILSIMFELIKNREKKFSYQYLTKLTILFVLPMLLLLLVSIVMNNYGITINERFYKEDKLMPLISVCMVTYVIYLIKYLLYLFAFSIGISKCVDKNENHRLLNQLILLVVVAVTYTMSFSLINFGAISYRMAYTMGMIPGILGVFLVIYSKNIEKCKKVIFLLLTIATIIELIVYICVYGIFVRYNHTVQENCKLVISYVQKWNLEHEEKLNRLLFIQMKILQNLDGFLLYHI